jgi:hypothetical protein
MGSDRTGGAHRGDTFSEVTYRTEPPVDRTEPPVDRISNCGPYALIG